jgi:D-alanine-D-alanine ligase
MTTTIFERELRIAVLLGGVSREREISFLSGEGVIGALKGLGHTVFAVVIDEERIPLIQNLDVDVAFIALHGRYGEDGGVQGELERLGIPYTGPGPAASWKAMDKLLSKKAFAERGIPTPPFLGFFRPFEARTIVDHVEGEFGYPVVVKPAREGSSIGVTIAEDRSKLEEGLRILESIGGAVLVERYIEGRELTVGILGGRALPIIELRTERRFFDFEAKYVGGTEYILNPELPVDLYGEIQETAFQAHRALGCEGLSRVDLILSREGRPFILEVNTIPGLTPKSLLPKAARTAGLSFETLCERIVDEALKRARKRHSACPAEGRQAPRGLGRREPDDAAPERVSRRKPSLAATAREAG